MGRACWLDLRHLHFELRTPARLWRPPPRPIVPYPSLRHHPRSPMGCCAAYRAAVTIHLPSPLRPRARNDTGWPRHEADRASWGAA